MESLFTEGIIAKIAQREKEMAGGNCIVVRRLSELGNLQRRKPDSGAPSKGGNGNSPRNTEAAA